MPLNIVTDPNPLRIDDAGAVRWQVPRLSNLSWRIPARSDPNKCSLIRYARPRGRYSVIAFYCDTAEVEAWLREVDAEAEAIREKIEARQSHLVGIRERLLERKRASEQQNASSAK
jgi:hypothetical protein